MALPTLADLTGTAYPGYNQNVVIPPSAQPTTAPTSPPSQSISDWILAIGRYGFGALLGTQQAQQQAAVAQQQAQIARQQAATSQNTLIGVGIGALVIILALLFLGGKGRGMSLGEFVGGSKTLSLRR